MPLPTYLMSNFPSVRPSLNLQFDSQPTPEDMTSHLASVGATFSRASIGTYTDANGTIQEATSGQARPNYSTAGVHEGLLIEESRTNLIKSSEQITTDWSQVGVSEFENYAIVSPNGKVNGVKISSNNVGFQSRHEYALTLTDDTDYSFTVFLKKASSQYGLLRFTTKDGTNNNVSVNFNASPVAISTDTTSSATLEDYGNDWYKVSMTVDSASGGTSPEIAIWGNTSDNFAIANPIGADVYFFGAQVEEGSFPTSYIPTIPTFTSRASDGTYFDSSGVLQTASTDEARIDHKYIDGQWVEAGLLLEGQVDNEFTYSEDFTTSWDLVDGTLTANDTTAPDGATTAEKITSDSDNTFTRVEKFPTLTDDTVYTISCFIKSGNVSYAFLNLRPKDGTSTITQYFDIDNVALGTAFNSPESATIEQFGDWVRCSVSINCSSGATIPRIQIGIADGIADGQTDTGDYMYIWGAQLEEGSQPTSYIATSGSTVTRSADVYTTATKERSADVCYIDGTAFSDFYNQEEGIIFVNFNKVNNDDFARVFNFYDGTITNRFHLDNSNSLTSTRLFLTKSGESSVSLTKSYNMSNDSKIVSYYDGSNIKLCINGGDVSSETAYALSNNIDRLQIGALSTSSAILNGKIKKLIYFPRALSDNELIKLTQ